MIFLFSLESKCASVPFVLYMFALVRFQLSFFNIFRFKTSWIIQRIFHNLILCEKKETKRFTFFLFNGKLMMTGFSSWWMITHDVCVCVCDVNSIGLCNEVPNRNAETKRRSLHMKLGGTSWISGMSLTNFERFDEFRCFR